MIKMRIWQQDEYWNTGAKTNSLDEPRRARQKPFQYVRLTTNICFV